VAKRLGDLLQETRQTKARIEEGHCSRQIEPWVADSIGRNRLGQADVLIGLVVALSKSLCCAVGCRSRRGRVLSGRNER
jgi:hypothetical protein